MKGRLLIVDDEVELMTVLRELVTQEGYEAVGVTSPKAALAALREGEFDLLLTDLKMPGMDGVSLLRAALDLQPQMVCVMMTGQGAVESAVEAMQSGAYDYLLKPFKVNAVLAVLSRALEARHLRLENARMAETEQRNAAELARAHSLLAALSQVAARIESTPDMNQIMETLGAELKPLGLTCLVALLDADDGALVIRYASIESEALALAVQLTGLKLRGFKMTRERLPFYADLVERRRAVYLTDGVSLAAGLMPGIPKPVVERIVRLTGVTPEARAIYLPLNVEERVLGILGTWGEGLQEEDIPTLSVFAAQLAAVLEVARLHEQVKSHHIEEQAALLKLSQALLSETEAQAMVDVAVRVAAEALRAEFASASLVEPQGKRYSVRAALGMPPEFLQNSQGIPLTVDNGLTHAIRTRETLIIPDEALEARVGVPSWVAELGIRTALIAPMLVGDRAVGGIVLNTRAPRDWTDDEARLLSLIANDTAQALERARLFAEVGKSETRYRTLVENASDGIFLSDSLGHNIDVNPRGCDMLGYSREEILSMTMADLIAPEDLAARPIRFDELRTGNALVSERQLRRKDGSLLPVEISARMLPDGRLQGIARDITERKRAEAALHESESHFRSLLESAPDGIVAVDQSGQIVLTNAQTEALFGYTRAELLGQSIEMLLPERFREAHVQHRAGYTVGPHIRQMGADLQLFALRKDGSEFPVDIVISPLASKEGLQTIAVVRDITERLKAEAERTKLASAITQAADNVFITDTNGVIEYVNPAFEISTGYKAEEAIGQTPRLLKSGQHHPEFFKKLWATILAGEVFRAQFVNRRKDGTLYFELKTITPVKDAQGRITHFVSVGKDITELKQAAAALERRVSELTVLHAVAAAGVEAGDEDELIARATQIIGDAFYPIYFGVLLVDVSAGVLRFHPSYRGLSDEWRQISIPLGQGITGTVAASGQPKRVTDVRREPAFIPARENMASELCVPLSVGGHVIGVINAESKTFDAFSEDDERLLTTVAGQLATAIDRLRAEATERQRAKELEALARVSSALRNARARADMLPIILDQVIDLLKADVAALAFRDQATGETVVEMARGAVVGGTGTRLPPGEGISGQVIATGQPYLTKDLRSDPRIARPDQVGDRTAAACIPLATQEEIIGTLWVARKQEIAYEELRLVIAIGDMAANAIHRAALHEKTERRVQRLGALHRIDAAIGASLDLGITFSVLLEQLLGQEGADAAAVLMMSAHSPVLEYRAGRGFRGNAIARTQLRLGEGIAGRAALERKIIFAPDVREAGMTFVRLGQLASEGFVSYYAVPLVAKGEVKGVLDIFSRSRLSADPEWEEFLETVGGQAAIAIDNAELFYGLQRSNVDLSLAYDTTLEGWARALDLRDHETENHTRRVTEMTMRLARVLGMSDGDLVSVRRGALLHDMGKMGIPDSILLKPGPLTDEEWATMRKHPQYAYDMLSPIAYLNPALDIPYCHHEKWDGSGYPRGLAGPQIPLAARIFAVADVWDALRSDRPYRARWPEEKVREHIRTLAGTHFDPQVAEAFLNMDTVN